MKKIKHFVAKKCRYYWQDSFIIKKVNWIEERKNSNLSLFYPFHQKGNNSSTKAIKIGFLKENLLKSCYIYWRRNILTEHRPSTNYRVSSMQVIFFFFFFFYKSSTHQHSTVRCFTRWEFAMQENRREVQWDNYYEKEDIKKKRHVP